jgi:hypothetical protein
VVAVELAFDASDEVGVSIGFEKVQSGFPRVGNHAGLILVMAVIHDDFESAATPNGQDKEGTERTFQPDFVSSMKILVNNKLWR